MVGQHVIVDDPFDVRADGTVVLRLHVQPGAGRSEVVGRHGTALKVRVGAPPDKGRANDAVLALVADVLGVARSAVELVAGPTSRAKRVAVRGRTPEEVRLALGNATAAVPVARRQP
ncbi:MAG: hypothetical protein JWO68_112 [Actinomycetia bacterium]|nr:hypothetical protein [Actinomycetes bacterium]